MGDATATANNLKIEVNYTTPTGEKLNPAAIPQGTDFIAGVVVTHTGSRAYNFEEMALTQISTSGWETLNARLHNMAEFSNTNVPEYQDIRDDRVLTRSHGLPLAHAEAVSQVLLPQMAQIFTA